MAIVKFCKGQKISIDGREFIISERLKTGDIQLYEPKTSDISTFKESYLLQLLMDGNLKVISAESVKHKFSDSDINALDENLKEEMKRRWQYVELYLQLAEDEKESAALRQKAIGIVASGLNDPNPPSEVTLYRWMREYRRSEDKRSLIPKQKLLGKAKKKINPNVDEIVKKAIDEVYLTEQKNSGKAVHNDVAFKIKIENLKRPFNEKLRVPNLSTVYRRIKEIDPYEKDKARYGKNYAKKKYRTIKKGKEASRPLERVEIDSTPIDVIVVDPDTKQVIGRPEMIVVIDCYSRQILGYYLSFESSSYLAIAECLMHCILPKGYVKEKYQIIKNTWDVSGVPEVIVCDNAKGYYSDSFHDACLQLGITIQYNPPSTPYWKGKIERFFGTLSKSVFHRLPGTTFSSHLDKGDYKSQEHAVMTLDDIEEILHYWIIDIYQMEFHEGIQTTPREKWLEGISKNPPREIVNQEELVPLFGAIEYRTIQLKGIELDGIIYNNDMLRQLSKQYKKGEKAKIKYSLSDLSMIWVEDKIAMNFILVPAVDTEYTNGLSKWVHKLHKKIANKKFKEANGDTLIESKAFLSELINKDKASGKKRTRKSARAENMGIKNTKPVLEDNKILIEQEPPTITMDESILEVNEDDAEVVRVRLSDE